MRSMESLIKRRTMQYRQGKGHSLYNGTLMQWGIHTEKRNGSGEDEGQDWCRGRVRA